MKFEPDVTPASRLDLSRAYAIDLARSLRRLAFKNVRRTNDVVDSEYNSGEWDRVLNQRAWLGGRTLEEFLIGQNMAPRLAKVDGRIVRITTRDYYRYRIGALSELIKRHAGAATSLLELGAGYGYNLFSLSLDPHWSRLRGFDIAPNGIEAGRQIASHFKLDDRVSFDRIDLTDAQRSAFQRTGGRHRFHVFLHRADSLCRGSGDRKHHSGKAGPRGEYRAGQSTCSTCLEPRDFASRVYIRSMDYQTRLFKLLDTLDAQGRIRILARERMGFAPTLHNDGLLYAWEPR